MLDDMDLERERGITIKARAVAMQLYATTAKTYELNLIDTPGHVDFHYEVSRSLAVLRRGDAAGRCLPGRRGPDRGQRLRRDGARPDDRAGAQQDRPASTPGPTRSSKRWSRCWRSIPTKCCACSGKTGRASTSCCAAIVERVPPPTGDPDAPLQAMVFDSHYDDYRGVITYVRVMNGTVRKGQKIRFMQGRHHARSPRAGPVRPAAPPCDELQAGQVGYLICNIKSLGQVHVGDTVTVAGDAAAEPLPGYQRAAADGLLRAVSVRRPGLRGAARRADQAQHQRPQLRVRARDERRPGLRLPLRLPGHAAHGDHPAAARARGRPRPGADRPQRHLRDPDDRPARRCTSTIRRRCPTPARSKNSASRS